MVRTPLGPKNANARVSKKKTSRQELSPHKRSVIEGMHLANVPNFKISRLTQTPESTVRTTIQLIPRRSKGNSLPRSGRPSKIDRTTRRNIIRYCRQNVKATYAQVKQELALDCCHRTIAEIIKEQGIKKWLAKKRPILTEEHAKQRYKWCKERLNWGVEEWKKYIWSDECSVTLGTGQAREWVFRTPSQKWEKDFIQPYKKGKGVTLMVWGAFGAGRRSELVFMPGDPDSKRGGVTSAVYLEVLEDMLPTLWEPGLEFMQDNAKIHTARIIKTWFAEQGIVVVEWPPYSPDLNPIEHVWARLKSWIYKHHPELLQLTGEGQEVKDRFLAALQEGWEALPEDLFEKLVKSMQRRVKAVKKAKGWYTKY